MESLFPTAAGSDMPFPANMGDLCKFFFFFFFTLFFKINLFFIEG